MALFHSFDISASGLTAQRLRMDTIANNIANVNTTRTPAGGPYRRQMPVFAPREGTGTDFRSFLTRTLRNVAGTSGAGVRVVRIEEDDAPAILRYEPNHPDADEEGYVAYPNVNIVTEMVDMIGAGRAYEANAAALESARDMSLRALEIGRG